MITLGMFWRTAFVVLGGGYGLAAVDGGPALPVPRPMRPIALYAPADVYTRAVPRRAPMLASMPEGTALLPELAQSTSTDLPYKTDCGTPTRPMPRPLRQLHGHPRVWVWECEDGWRWHELRDMP